MLYISVQRLKPLGQLRDVFVMTLLSYQQCVRITKKTPVRYSSMKERKNCPLGFPITLWLEKSFHCPVYFLSVFSSWLYIRTAYKYVYVSACIKGTFGDYQTKIISNDGNSHQTSTLEEPLSISEGGDMPGGELLPWALSSHIGLVSHASSRQHR